MNEFLFKELHVKAQPNKKNDKEKEMRASILQYNLQNLHKFIVTKDKTIHKRHRKLFQTLFYIIIYAKRDLKHIANKINCANHTFRIILKITLNFGKDVIVYDTSTIQPNE